MPTLSAAATSLPETGGAPGSRLSADAGGLAPGFAPQRPGWPPLAALISSRVCHDLISPVGAVCNGVELIEQFGATGDQEMALIGDSARAAAALLELFRAAFGSGAPEAVYGLDRLRKTLAARFAKDRVALEWEAPQGGETSRLLARIAALGAMGAAGSLPRGGALRVGAEGPTKIHLHAEGPTLRMEPSVGAWLSGAAGDRIPEGRDVQWVAARAYADEAGGRLEFSHGETWFSLTATGPTPG